MIFVSGRQAAINMVGTQLKGDHLEGGFYAHDINDRMQRVKINVSYIDVNETGYCHGGSYTGVYASLVNNESDWTQVGLGEADCDVLPGHFGPVLAAFENTMFSFRRNHTGSSKESQFVAMMKTTSVEVYVTLLLVILVIQQLLVLTARPTRASKGTKSKIRRNWQPFGYLFLMCAMFVRQLQPPVNLSSGRRQLCLAFMILAFFVGQFVMYMYESSLLIKEPVESIDTLEDLANSANYTAGFPYAFNLWRKFMHAKNFPVHKIWHKTMAKFNNDTTRFLLPLNKVTFDADTIGHQVTIMLRPMTGYLLELFCDVFASNDAFDGLVPFIGKEWIMPDYYLSATRSAIDPNLRERLHWFYISILEHGYNDYFVGRSDNPYYSQDELKKCMRTARDRSFMEQTSGDVAGSSYLTLLQGYVSLILISICILLMELFAGCKETSSRHKSMPSIAHQINHLKF